MKIDQQKVGTVDLLTPMGPLVDEDAVQFCELLAQRLSSTHPRVVVSMQEVSYVDSTALEGFLDATENLRARASILKLAQVTSTCREILELTGLSGRFRFFNDVQDAVRSFL